MLHTKIYDRHGAQTKFCSVEDYEWCTIFWNMIYYRFSNLEVALNEKHTVWHASYGNNFCGGIETVRVFLSGSTSLILHINVSKYDWDILKTYLTTVTRPDIWRGTQNVGAIFLEVDNKENIFLNQGWVWIGKQPLQIIFCRSAFFLLVYIENTKMSCCEGGIYSFIDMR